MQWGRACCRAGHGGFNEAKQARRVFIGVVEYNQRLRLVASSGPLKVMTNWQESNIDPNVKEKEDGAYRGLCKGFDFAPYKLAKDHVAFGIRVAWVTMYAGGGGMFDALMLFLVQADKIVNVLSEPKNVVRVLPHKQSGYFDIQLKERGGKWKKTFQWDAEANRYLALPR